jgi:hypothetical protein
MGKYAPILQEISLCVDIIMVGELSHNYIEKERQSIFVHINGILAQKGWKKNEHN